MQSDEAIRLQVPLESLDLPLRTHNTLLDAGVCTVGDLVRLSTADLKEMINRITPTSIRAIHEALHAHGLFLFGDCKE